MVTIGLPGVFFLNPRRVGEHESAQISSARRAEDRTTESSGHQPGKVPHMIEMRVRQYHGIDIRRGDRKGIPVPKAKFLEPLEQSTIHKDAPPQVLDHEFRASDGACCTSECQSSHDRRYIMRR